MKVIYAMWLRQLKKYWRSKPRMIGALGQPLLFLIALGFGFGPIFEKAGGGSYLQFLAPGVIAMSILMTAMFSGIEVIWDRQFGFLKETLVAPVSRVEIMVGRTLGGATVAFLQGLLVLIISYMFGFRFNFLELPLAIVFMLFIAILFTAFGTALASRLDDMQAFPLIMNFLVMPIFFLSGALFPLSGLPKGIRIVSYLNPLSYGVDGLREALINVGSIGIYLNLVILTVCVLIIGLLGTYMFSKIQI